MHGTIPTTECVFLLRVNWADAKGSGYRDHASRQTKNADSSTVAVGEHVQALAVWEDTETAFGVQGIHTAERETRSEAVGRCTPRIRPSADDLGSTSLQFVPPRTRSIKAGQATCFHFPRPPVAFPDSRNGRSRQEAGRRREDLLPLA